MFLGLLILVQVGGLCAGRAKMTDNMGYAFTTVVSR